jgi:glycosyltransferase involved in cell wall biosynthesis
VFQPNAWSFQAATGAARRAAVAWERLAVRWTAAVVCVSEAERALAQHAGVRARFDVVPNGVDLTTWTPASDDDRRRARATLGLEDAPLAVCVGALRRQKGQDVLLDAWPVVRRSVADARLVLVGDGPERDTLERRAGDAVRFAGDRTDVPDWLAAADVVVLPSRWEGMSYVLLEAMARARSVVTTDVPGAREAIADAGAVVPVEAVSALADAVAERFHDPVRAAAEGRRARERVERSHDVRRATESTAMLYAELLDRTRPRT